MIAQLKKHHRWNETLFLGFLSLTCFAFFFFRVFYTGSIHFKFLNWNLFLAFIPWSLTTLVMISPRIRQNNLILFPMVIIWLLFFPNAPYILTDLFHLSNRSSMPIWFDLILILSFAWVGLLFGLLSLWDLQTLLQEKFNRTFSNILIVALLFLASFGIYLGRFLRWNSWDILQEPFGLVYDIGNRLMNPLEHPRTWGMTLFMGVFLNMIFWSLKFMLKERNLKRRLA